MCADLKGLFVNQYSPRSFETQRKYGSTSIRARLDCPPRSMLSGLNAILVQ